MVRYGAVWCGTIHTMWCVVLWCGMVWFCDTSYSNVLFEKKLGAFGFPHRRSRRPPVNKGVHLGDRYNRKVRAR